MTRSKSRRRPEHPACCTWSSRVGSCAWSREARSGLGRSSTCARSFEPAASKACWACVCPRLCDEPTVRRRLHGPERQHARRSVPLGREHGATGQRQAAPLRQTAVRQSQRRHGGVWQGRARVRRHGRRRLGRRPREPRPESPLAPRQDPAPRSGASGCKARVVALGVRNPWRFSFDRENGDLWIGDVGQGSIEEVDHVAWPWQGQLNFGWDVYEGRASFERKALGPGRLVRPVAQYTHAKGCSITGGYIYRGSAVPSASRKVLLRRLLQRHGVVAEARRRGGPPGPRGAVHRSEPELVRRGQRRRVYAVSQRGELYRLAG